MDTLVAKTFYLHDTLSDEQINNYETSNNVLISNTLFQEIMNNHDDKKMLILGLYYKNKKIFVNIDGYHNNEDNLIYIPLWIYQYFNYTDDEQINYMKVSPKIGSKIKIKPHEDFYAYLPDPVQSLRDGFEKYSILLNNTTIPLNINGRTLMIDVLDTYSNNNPINIRGIELEVDIEEIQEEIKKEIQEEIQKEIEEDINNIAFYQNILEETKEKEIDFSSMLPPSFMQNIIQPNKFPGKGHRLKE
jgi:hypothetical protein